MRIKLLHTLIAIIFGGSLITAQDLHYSQFFASPMNINPALTGIFNGDVRFFGNYRNQWNSVPVPYMTFTGGADLKFLGSESDNFFSGGLIFNYDQAGDSRLRLGALGLSGSYTIKTSENLFLTFGALISGGQRAFSLSDLRFDAQYDGGQFDPTRSIQESFDNTNITIFDINAGANLRWQKTPRSKFDFGVGVFHLNAPTHPFYESNDVKVPLRFDIHAIGGLEIASKLDLLLRGIYQGQGPHSEALLGAGLLIHLNQNLGKEFGLEIAGHYRFGDAIAPMVRLHFRSLEVGMSYDINFSDFDVATLNRGGPEFSLIYRLTKVKPLSSFKVCPIF